MSIEKNREEALRWIRTAKDDLDTAEVLRENGKYSHACFHAQQAAEKSIKAIWYSEDADPWGHSIKKLIDGLQQVNLEIYNEFKDLVRSALILDRFYIPTRYPNGLPDLIPTEAYAREDSDDCIRNSALIFNKASSLLVYSE
jgi:HEPN domain-containing protein